MSSLSVLNIGKPCAYHPSVDPQHRIGKFLRGRMSIIDLIPCSYRINFSKGMDKQNDSSGLLPQVVYDDSIEEYTKTCQSYGLDPYAAIRLFTTDDTTASDTFSNVLKDNYFQSGLNQMSEKLMPIRDFMRSVDGNSVPDVVNSMSSTAKKTLGSSQTVSTAGQYVKDSVGTSNAINMKNVAEKLLSAATDVIAKGHRISLPSIWSDSNYTPNFQAVIKLASPYGDPKSIKEFIIKPLMYLLILSSPKTTDGVSYGHPFCLTIKGYGINYSPIGMIANITLRRGGNDTSFNIFRQPLTIDVSLDFNYLVKGFAHYHFSDNLEENIFDKATDFDDINMDADTALPTVGHILTSLRPRNPDFDYMSYSHVNMTSNIPKQNYIAINTTQSTSVFDPVLSSKIIINQNTNNIYNNLINSNINSNVNNISMG
jgi:hypothetical protein